MFPDESTETPPGEAHFAFRPPGLPSPLKPKSPPPAALPARVARTGDFPNPTVYTIGYENITGIVMRTLVMEIMQFGAAG